MNWTLLATRMVLSVVFVAAGFAKLLDRKGSQKAIQDFGLPLWAAAPFGIGLPVAEIIVAFLLLSVRSAWMGALGALALLVVFTVVIAINVALGRRPACHCFGQVHSEPVGWFTVARNGLLAFLAAVLVWEGRTNPGVSIRSVMRDFTASQLLAGTLSLLALTAFAALFWLVLHLFKQNGRLLVRIEALEASRAHAPQQLPARVVPQGLPIGTKAIPFDLPRVNGGRATLEGLLSDGKPLLLISTDPNCGPCTALLPDIAAWQKRLVAEVNVVLLSHGRHADNRAKVAQHGGLTNVLLEKDHHIAEKYHALGTPTAVLIRSDGTIGSPAVGGADAIRQLVSDKVWTDAGLATFMKTLGQPVQAAPQKLALPVGSPAPAFALPDLSGSIVDSAHFNGNGTMLVFWNPGCGFCQRMLPQLKDWERAKPGTAPRLVLISNGSREANRAMSLSSTILIDAKFTVGQRYGASGTPSGLLIDPDGKVRAGLAVGEPALMELLTGSKAKPDAGKVAVARTT